MNSYNGFSSNVRAKVGNIQLKAIKSGKFPKPTQCELCLSTDGQMQLHNEDYSKPFADAHPICRSCHLALHIRFTNSDRWRKRKADINERRLEAGEEIGSNWWDHLINQPIVMHESLSAKELKELQDRDLKLLAELLYDIYSAQKSK